MVNVPDPRTANGSILIACTPRVERPAGRHPSTDSVGVTLKPWRSVLPFRQAGVIIADRHLHVRQTVFVEDFVIRDHPVEEKQVGRQRIDLIGGEAPLIPDRHGATDVIPRHRRIRRGPWQYALRFPEGDIRVVLRLQRGAPAVVPGGALTVKIAPAATSAEPTRSSHYFSLIVARPPASQRKSYRIAG